MPFSRTEGGTPRQAPVQTGEDHTLFRIKPPRTSPETMEAKGWVDLISNPKNRARTAIIESVGPIFT
ncbi:hypothetical protein AMELA_G00211460 [Ameiurus melas]|uniref:Uncharacterized protein n=1 Tax=Ameiurus melas TaxID=219545 RepID=A0A7J6A4S9_AMEME|nr:hypothetical protein AMELA_G00211460 [Ameiurus melas]